MGKMAVAVSPPLTFLTLRFFIAALLMVVILKLIGVQLFNDWQETRLAGALGLFNNSIYLGLCWVAFKTTSAGMVAIIVGLSPLITALIANLWLKEALGFRRILGLLAGLGGAWWVIYMRFDQGLEVESVTGIISVFIAMFALSFGTLLYRRYGTHPTYNLWRVNMIQSLAGGVFLVPFIFLEPWGEIQFSLNFVLIMAYAVLMVSILSLLMWLLLIKRAGAAGASTYHFLNPALALFFAWAILGEQVTTQELIGIPAIILGILLVNWPART